MAETMQEIIAKLDVSEILSHSIYVLRRRKPSPKSRAREPDPLWVRVKKMTTLGSTYGTALCLKYGFNPDETWRTDS